MTDEIVACRECGSVNAEATELVGQLRADIRHLEADLRAKRARLAAMRGEQASAAEGAAEKALALEVLSEWKRLCSPRARELNGPRLEKTLARLRAGYTADQLRQCIHGYAARPYVVGGVRSSIGLPSQRHVDPDVIFRDAKHVDAGIAIGDEEDGDRIPLDAIERISWRQVQRANRQLIVSTLEHRFGGPLEDGGFLSWPCPRCDNDPATTLRIAPTGYSWLAACSTCGLTDDVLLGAVRR